MSTKKIFAPCPLCKKTMFFDVDEALILESQRFPVPFVVEHCDRTLIAYIDSNFKVRGIESVFNIFDKTKQKQEEKEEIVHAELITPDFVNRLTPDEKTIFCCSAGCDAILREKIPNILNKQIITMISRHKEISLAILLKKLEPLEKALNRTIDRTTILKVLKDYLEKGIIVQETLKFEDGIKIVETSKELSLGDV